MKELNTNVWFYLLLTVMSFAGVCITSLAGRRVSGGDVPVRRLARFLRRFCF